MIEFKDTEAVRAGKSIQELRRRNRLSLYEFAKKANLSPEYLTRIEEGCQDKVSEDVIEIILKTGRVQNRGQYTSDDLKRVLLSISPPNPPEKLRLL